MTWITSFLFLYGAIYLFERKRTTLDWFQVLAVALVPAIMTAIKSGTKLVTEVPPMVDLAVWLATYPIVFLLLWKMMALNAKRAAAYTVALFAFDIALGALVGAVVGRG